ncbi:MAG: hypothetical protein ACT4P4_23025 [Betaproteobacteria bacterium]
MCYEFEQEYMRQRAEEARRTLEEERRRREERPAPAKPDKTRDKTPVSQPDPVPV